MSPTHRLICLTLPGYPDPSIAIAASRAGALGVLDLEYARDVDAARAALARLARWGRGACGVKIDLANEEFAALLQELPPEIETILIARPSVAELPEQIQALQHSRRCVLVEATDAHTAAAAASAGAAGIILKGNEAGGRIGEETAFVLFQRCMVRLTVPVWVHGGIGAHTAAACIAAGAAGVVMDWQLALTRESPLPESIKDRLAKVDGSETILIGGGPLGDRLRVYARPELPALEALLAEGQRLAADEPPDALPAVWRDTVARHVGSASVDPLLLVSQDAAFAADLARQHRTVAGIARAIEQAIPDHIRTAQHACPLDAHGLLAVSHGTRYPILQGPMTRVSDVASFCEAVAAGGALPFLALALMRAPQVEALLQETKERIGERPWGVGLLGFAPAELRQEQLEVVRRYRPPFAIIAGGRPDQAAQLEQDGIASYLHVPSPGLLELFLGSDARRFIFEGRECGGHVGPRSSFVLWQSMVDLMIARIDAGSVKGADCHVVFAGGIHDARSAAMVAVMASPLIARGVKIGVLMGTAYLFTEEAVASGAITDGFQREALQSDHTVLLETGPGHAIRCLDTPFIDTFQRETERLLASQRPHEAGEPRLGRAADSGGGRAPGRAAMEALNLGRLRIASKGIKRHPEPGSDTRAPRYVPVSAEEQRAEGVFMSGQIAALRASITTIDDLHQEVAVGGTAFLKSIDPGRREEAASPRPCDVAIIGMSTLLPKAPTLQQYWENIVQKVDAIEEVPKERWDTADYFDADRQKRDRVYSRWGGFLEAIPFDPVAYGMPPNSVRFIEPLQLLALETARAALADAGYADRPFNRERTSVILGAGGGASDLGQLYGFRSMLPMFFGAHADTIVDQLGAALPEWSEDSFAGFLMNVAAGRIANRLDLGGANFTVDAACASSLAAVYLAVRELETGASDMVLVGGADTMQGALGYMAFSKTHALSPRGRCRTFDESADGIVISEGLAMLVLKRLEDAERDGDRIYAVIKGIGSSSDGRDKGLTAPRPEGQIRALERAYAKAGISPATVGLMEAHGTGTVAGDRAEVTALAQFFTASRAERQSCAIGSVKSMIGHTKCTAGVAGLVKAALALHHKVLPPTLGVEAPNATFNIPGLPFYVNSETRPWLRRANGTPRRAGVSAFGFGGTNFHAVVEEYSGGYLPAEMVATHYEGAVPSWPSELFLWSARDRAGLLEAIAPVEQALASGATPSLADLAFTVCSCTEEQEAGETRFREGEGGGAAPSRPRRFSAVSAAGAGPRAPSRRRGPGPGGVRLAVVARSLDDLRRKLAGARARLADSGCAEIVDPGGVFFSDRPLASLRSAVPGARCPVPGGDAADGPAPSEPGTGHRAPGARLAFLFPGQGSQYPEMGRDLALHFFEARTTYEEVDAHLAGRYHQRFSAWIFPPPSFTDEEAQANRKALMETHVAQPALGAMAVATSRVLQALGIAPERVAGHSYGEFVALWAAGVFDDETLFRVSEARGRFMRESSGSESALSIPPGGMAAVEADAATVSAALAGLDGVVCANINAPRQTVIAGPREKVEQAMAAFEARGLRARALPVACAFHSPLVAGAGEQLAVALAEVTASRPSIPVYSNTTGAVHAGDPGTILARMAEHLTQPVEFVREIEAMYEDGARIFVEVGPRGVLTGLVSQILAGRPHAAVATDQEGRQGLYQLQLALARLAAEGVDVATGRLFAGRNLRRLDLREPDRFTIGPVYTPTTWLVNGARAVPLRDADKPVPSFRVHLPGLVTSRGSEAFADAPNGAGERRSPMSNLGPMLAATGAKANGHAATPSANGHASAPSANGHASPALMHGPAHLAPEMAPAQVSVHPLPTASLKSAEGATPTTAAPPASQRVTASGAGLRPDAVAVVAQFQQVMSRFLDTQRAVMLTYLGGAAGATATPEHSPALSPVPGLAPPMPAGAPAAPTAVPITAAAQPMTQPAPAPVGGRPTDPLGPMSWAAAAAAPHSTGGPPCSPSALATAAVAPSDLTVPPLVAAPSAAPILETGTPSAPASLTRESVTRQLLEIVTERTGYPDEMLGLDLELEADLGIDSIKRLEILGTFQQQFGASADQMETAMEELAGIKTLRGIIDWVLQAAAPEALPGRALGEPDDNPVSRATLQVVPAPPVSPEAGLAPGGVLLVTDDGGGVAAALVQRLGESGRTVALARPGVATSEVEPGIYTCAFHSAEAVQALATLVRARQGTVAGVLHLLPVRPAPGLDRMDLPGWRARLGQDVAGLFHLAQAFREDLHASAQQGGAVVLAVTGMGGAFGVESSRRFFPGNGGVTGLAKTLAREWPDVRVRAIDLDPEDGSEVTAGHLLAELYATDSESEIGYLAGQRRRLSIAPTPLIPSDPGVALPASSVILLTGGARGITAEVARYLARQYRPTLLLTGRSPQPAPLEDAETASLLDASALKAMIADRMRREGKSVLPAQVEQEYRRVLQEREMRETLRAIEAAGARARYFQVDMRDEDAVRRFLDDVYREYGRLDGVIHGAGIIEDRLIGQKDPASFQRVFETKADSAFLLSRLLRFDRLQFLVFFSSVSGQFGNRGQGDYAAANEVLNKLAQQLDRDYPTRVVAINWGPWATAGMVSPELQRWFSERGIRLIPSDVGVSMLDQEIGSGHKSDAEVVIAGGGWQQAGAKGR